MELLTLDSNYQPSELVERYGSLLWTERYSSTGDFQLITTDVERMYNLLPRNSVVTLRESTVPMIVEVHKIEKGLGGAPVLTITGRSFESVLERRAAVKIDPFFYQASLGPARLEWFEDQDKSSDAAYIVMRTMLGDIARPPFSAVDPMISLNDALPMIDLTLPADFSYGATNKYEIKPGNLYTIVLELLRTNHHGLKAVRPTSGEIKVGIEIYNGADLTVPGDPDNVVFDARFDQFEQATYLLSEAGSNNIAYVFTKTGSQVVDKNTPPPARLGLDRRVLYVDLSSEEGVDGANASVARKTRALIELYKYNATALFDGQIGEQVAAGYNAPGGYTLGDIIRLDGEYGLSQNVRVAEFIRSDDNTGSKAYPTFETVIP